MKSQTNGKSLDKNAVVGTLVEASGSEGFGRSLTSAQSSANGAARIVYSIDSYLDGISINKHRIRSNDLTWEFPLAIEEDSAMLSGERFEFSRGLQPFHELEVQLARLSRQGVLRESVFYLGVNTDPFHPFDQKFDASMKLLELLAKYQPGMVFIQTRSPLLVIAMPQLAKLGLHCAVNVPIETTDERVRRFYTPTLPTIEERMSMIIALRRFGIEVNVQAGPLLPYGDWRTDANAMAKELVKVANRVQPIGFSDGSEQREQELRGSTIVKRLANDRKFHWLREDASEPLRAAIAALDSEKLLPVMRPQLQSAQLGFFAA
jgi:hypothetical protein